jgi:hypothetical protein
MKCRIAFRKAKYIFIKQIFSGNPYWHINIAHPKTHKLDRWSINI